MAAKTTKVNGVPAPAGKKPRGSVDLSGETLVLDQDLSFDGRGSKYDKELSVLQSETEKSETPEKVYRFYKDEKAITMLKNRAAEKKVHVQVAKVKHPVTGAVGFAVRLDPDQSKPFPEKKKKTSEATSVPPVPPTELVDSSEALVS